MDTEQAALLDGIKRAFGHVRHPGWDAVYHGHPAWDTMFTIRDWEIEEAEQNIDSRASWKDIGPVTLRNAEFLLWTTPCGFEFFLPAFMWQAIVDPDELDIGLSGLLHWLAGGPGLQAVARLIGPQLDALSAEQKAVVRAFVIYAMERDLTAGFDHEELGRVWGIALEQGTDDGP